MKNMKKINIFIGITIITLVALGFVTFFNKTDSSVSQMESEVSRPVVEQDVSLIINNGEELSLIFKSKFREGITVFDLLEEKTVESGLDLKVKTYDIGILIEAIGEVENGKDGKYWLYYINGEMPMVAVDKKEINSGDEIEFKFEKSSF